MSNVVSLSASAQRGPDWIRVEDAEQLAGVRWFETFLSGVGLVTLNGRHFFKRTEFDTWLSQRSAAA